MKLNNFVEHDSLEKISKLLEHTNRLEYADYLINQKYGKDFYVSSPHERFSVRTFQNPTEGQLVKTSQAVSLVKVDVQSMRIKEAKSDYESMGFTVLVPSKVSKNWGDTNITEFSGNLYDDVVKDPKSQYRTLYLAVAEDKVKDVTENLLKRVANYSEAIQKATTTAMQDKDYADLLGGGFAADKKIAEIAAGNTAKSLGGKLL